MRLLLLGKPGSGKGTQAKQLSVRYGVVSISTGDLIRAAISTGSELGKKFQEFNRQGLLVPDSLVVDMVRERLAHEDCRAGFLLDGFPRTIPQAEALQSLLQDIAHPLDAVVHIQVPDELLVERATGRRVCSHCKSTYHVSHAAPKTDGVCDNCGESALIQREDDKEDVVRNRLVEYRDKTAPLVPFYEKTRILVEIDGVGSLQEVESRIESALDSLQDKEQAVNA